MCGGFNGGARQWGKGYVRGRPPFLHSSLSWSYFSDMGVGVGRGVPEQLGGLWRVI